MKRGAMLLLAVVAVGAMSFFGWAPTAWAGVNDFVIKNYDIDYKLGRDGDGRSTLLTTETITAIFPSFDQNHGIERAVPTGYDGHGISLTITSVKDQQGRDVNYVTRDENDNRIVRVGDKNSYVHGEQIYVITYAQRDVTRYFVDTDADEFYWDTNGVDWKVPIEKLQVRLTIDPSITTAKAATACYRGVLGATSTCELKNDSFGQFSVEATNLSPGENVTIAVGLTKRTFAAYQPSLLERIIAIWKNTIIATTAIGLAIGVWVLARFRSLTERVKEAVTIVPEYLPPSDASVTASAKVGGHFGSVMTAQLLDLAVRHFVKIHEVKPKTLWRLAEYEVEIVKDVTSLRWEEKELLSDMFGALPSVGERHNLKLLRNNTAYYNRTLNNDTDLNKRIRGEYGLRAKDPATVQWLRKFAVVCLCLGVVLLSPAVLFAGLLAFGLSFATWRLTDKGLALKRYLEGLKMYISVAETERLRMLQSPEGAEKVASVAHGTDTAQLVKLYERVLPYAVLFGQEKEWNKQLGQYYETSGQKPDWYKGNSSAFNAVAFSSAMSSFSSSNSYASSSSSSSGGSSGGGSSGGGGGGGGGGGW